MSYRDRILESLREKAKSVKELSESLGTSTATIRQTLGRGKGKIFAKTEQGRWQLSDSLAQHIAETAPETSLENDRIQQKEEPMPETCINCVTKEHKLDHAAETEKKLTQELVAEKAAHDQDRQLIGSLQKELQDTESHIDVPKTIAHCQDGSCAKHAKEFQETVIDPAIKRAYENIPIEVLFDQAKKKGLVATISVKG